MLFSLDTTRRDSEEQVDFWLLDLKLELVWLNVSELVRIGSILEMIGVKGKYGWDGWNRKVIDSGVCMSVKFKSFQE